MAGQAPPQLSPSSLFENQAKLDSLKVETYNRILGTVHHKIKFAAGQLHSGQICYFDVPDWQPGCPRYDVKDCILYIVWNLRHSGFKVLYISPNRLLISWQEQSIQYYQEESPIRQAMVAATQQPTVALPSQKAKPKGPERKKPTDYRPVTAEGVAGMLASGGGGSRPKNGGTITFI